MSVRVIARVRPLLRTETEKDKILDIPSDNPTSKTTVKIPNPKCQSESFSFQFNSVYDSEATQAQLFENEGRRREVHAVDLPLT